MRHTGVGKGWISQAAGSPQGGLLELFQVTAAQNTASLLPLNPDEKTNVCK